MTQMEPFILFELAGTTYGVRSRFVQQIEMIEDVASVPNAHAAVEGVVLVRGQVIPALNLRTRFGFEKIERDLRSRMVVINTGNRVVGLLVDTAREYLKGIATIDGRMILVLNLDAVLDLDYEIEPQIPQT